MSDRLYIVTCSDSITDDITYHCEEPARLHEFGINSFTGGFSHKISNAITHTNIMLAYLERCRISKIYTNFNIRVKIITTKNLFKAILSE